MSFAACPAPHALPLHWHTFSTSPPATWRADRLDFERLGFPEHKHKFALLIHDLLARVECADLFSAAEVSESNHWSSEIVNVDRGRQEQHTDIRLCVRVDDLGCTGYRRGVAGADQAVFTRGDREDQG